MNPDFDVEHFFDDLIGVSKNIRTRPHRITFRATREQSQYIKTKPLPPSQKQIDKARHRKDKVTNVIGIQQERNMLTNYNNETKKRFKAALKEL